MDYMIFAALVGITILRIILTYDIICQWSKNFRKRMADFPPEMRIPESTRVDVAIPGWHINAHGEKCRENFNLSYMEGAGRTVGEDIETTWAGTNALGSSVREMGPAARHDTMNDHWNGWNFRKIVGFRACF
jgi:Kyakuja-Dileera-Zisupton transposase